MADDREFEQSSGERRPRRRDALSAGIWALILIWAGVVLLVDNLGIITRTVWEWAGLGAWALVCLGAAALLLIEIILRVIVPAYRRSLTGRLILFVVLVGVGLGNWLDLNITIPAVLIVLGLALLLRGFFRGK